MSDEHPESREREEHEKRPAGSGTSSDDSVEKHQAGSYSRDAEQDPDDAPDSTAD
ncbi:MAG TPA: hypothetical protein VGF46_03285 [Gaiellales bacterium]